MYKVLFNKLLILYLLTILLPRWNVCAQGPNRITIEDCYRWTRENYPQLRTLDLLDEALEHDRLSASAGRLPKLSINGQASYQSEVTHIPLDIPGVPILDKDQYKVYAEVFQPLTAGPHIRNRKEMLETRTGMEKQDVEVNLYRLRERVNQLYFGILLTDARLRQLGLLRDNLQSSIRKMEAAVEFGLVTPADKDLLYVEWLMAGQRVDEQRANRTAYLRMLSLLTGQSFTDSTEFSSPPPPVTEADINRPELRLFDLRQRMTDLQSQQVSNRAIPSLGLFFQGGYGRPALNFLDNDFEFYYIGGVKLTWDLGWLYNSRHDRQSLDLLTRRIEAGRESFLLQTDIGLLKQTSEIEKYSRLTESDEEIIAVRNRVRLSAETRLTEGLITPLDYIQYINAEDEARQARILHEYQLRMAQYEHHYISGTSH